MYINATGHYVPEERVPNEKFLELNGLTSEWILQRPALLEDMRKREEVEHTVILVHGHSLLVSLKRGIVLTMTKHNPFTVACCTACI